MHEVGRFICEPVGFGMKIAGLHTAEAFVCPDCDDTHLKISFPDLGTEFEMRLTPKDAEDLAQKLLAPQASHADM